MQLSTETRSVVMEREMKHPPEKVWRALTQGPLLEAWLMANDFEPVVGHKFTFRAKPMPPQWDGIIQSEVLEVEANQHLAYRWDSMGVETVVTWTLTRTEAGTLVRMEQSGFRSDQDNNCRGAQYGWQQFLAKLETVLDQP
jgi:uncharacterized protein YndB with AHSA1/START domain